jgi:pyrroline-5-carboxylate reductase
MGGLPHHFKRLPCLTIACHCKIQIFFAPHSYNKSLFDKFKPSIHSTFSLPLNKTACYKTFMATPFTIGFFGAGKMAAALASGFIHAELVGPKEILASDPHDAARKRFVEEVGGETTASNADVLKFANTVILAVKPNHVADVLAALRNGFTNDHLLISIAAGVTLAKMESALPAGARVIRVMPNTPALVGESASAFALGKNATAADSELAKKLLSAVGIAFQVKEDLLDAVTGLSGSGPAYVFSFIEGLIDGGMAAGLPRDMATKLAAQTVLGAAKMVLETGQNPSVLRDMVTSPGGTTVEGLKELEKGKLRDVVMNAVRAATEKSKKLGQD